MTMAATGRAASGPSRAVLSLFKEPFQIWVDTGILTVLESSGRFLRPDQSACWMPLGVWTCILLKTWVDCCRIGTMFQEDEGGSRVLCQGT